jgi:hypothetical protein
MCGGINDNYRFLGNLYNPLSGGLNGEYNEDCLDDERRHCTLTDGTTGKCVLNGICVSSFLTDHVQNNLEIPKPRCTEPYNKQSCPKYCACLGLLGVESKNCEEECRSWFHPYSQ